MKGGKLVQEENINEMSSMIMNKEYIRKDIVEITNLFKNMVQEKYISKMNDFAIKHKENAIKNPTKEVILMEAIKPFLEKEARFNIDRMIEMINIINTAKSIQMEVQNFKAQSIDSSME